MVKYHSPPCMIFTHFRTAIDEEGIFRLSGSALEIEKLRVKADQGIELNYNGMPYHNVSGVLKLFIRSMPTPFVNFELYDTFLAAVSMLLKKY